MAVLSYALGVLGWIYIGCYRVLAGPVKYVIQAQMAGHLSICVLIIAVVKGFFYLSLAGGVWCIGYMLKDYFKK